MRLRTKFSLSFILLAIIPLLFATLIPLPLNRQSLRVNAQEYQKSIADSAILELNHMLNEAQSTLHSIRFMLSNNTQQGMQLKKRLQLAKALIGGRQFVHEVTIYNRQGLFAERMKSDVDMFLPPTPKKILIPKRLKTKDEIHFPDIELHGKNGAYQPLILPMFIRNPTTGKKNLFGYLRTEVALQPLAAKLERMSKLRFEGKSDRLFLINQDFQIIIHPDSRKIGKKAHDVITKSKANLRSGLFYAFDYKEKDKKLFVILHSIRDLGLGVVVFQTQKTVYRVLTSLWRTAIVVGIIFALLAIFLGFWMGSRLSKPIKEISEAAKVVAGGDFSTRVKFTGKDEVGEMASSFNTMATDLGNYREKLVEETAIRTDLARYLNSELIESIVKRKEELKLGGNRQKITVMFADIVGFTPIIESHPPERVVAIMNELFTFITEIIFRHGGIIDKFMGDCVMAVFGAPTPNRDDSLQAARAAEEILHWLEIGNAKWQKELGIQLEMGIGLNSGEAIVGNIGSEKRMEYTVIGSSVNLAAGLEVLAKPGQILVTSETYTELDEEFDGDFIGSYQLPGRQQTVDIYSLSC